MVYMSKPALLAITICIDYIFQACLLTFLATPLPICSRCSSPAFQNHLQGPKGQSALLWSTSWQFPCHFSFEISCPMSNWACILALMKPWPGFLAASSELLVTDDTGWPVISFTSFGNWYHVSHHIHVIIHSLCGKRLPVSPCSTHS